MRSRFNVWDEVVLGDPLAKLVNRLTKGVNLSHSIEVPFPELKLTVPFIRFNGE